MLLTQHTDPRQQDPSQAATQQRTATALSHFGVTPSLDYHCPRSLYSSSPSSSSRTLLQQPSLDQAVTRSVLGRTARVDLTTGDQTYLFDSMQADPWFVSVPHESRTTAGRFSHHRESSLSSLGSAGPASPFSHNTSNPHIALHDSTSDGFSDMAAQETGYYQLAKTGKGPYDGLYADYIPFGSDGSVPDPTFPGTAGFRRSQVSDRALHPGRDMVAFGHGRSHPASVASSAAGDSPATPSLGEPEEELRRRPATAFHSVPKLDRTMTDVYSDELYSPNFTITSASPIHLPVSPTSDLFAQRLHAANSQHLSAAQSPISTSSRSRSPFTQGSPLAPAPGQDFASRGPPAPQARFSSPREGQERPRPDYIAQSRSGQGVARVEPETPKTISPQDAMLEFNDSDMDPDANFPLFPPEDAFLGKDGLPRLGGEHFQPHGLPGTDASSLYSAPPLPSSLRIPQHYPFIAQRAGAQDTMARSTSADSGSSDSQVVATKPDGSRADGGTYTCTYHGCTQRFDTAVLLQKHKREGHRQAQSIPGSRRTDAATAASMMTQAGPHKCDRINPSTGKPCNTIFSRPYDLTRHEDTIHNARKQKVRCSLCTEEKTFSRADALTRHFRVCHPEVDFPGKHRRRAAQV